MTDRSVDGLAYGEFLSAIFDEWVRHDVGEMFVQFFDGVLAAYVRGDSSLCVLRPTCGDGVALEHNGDLYSCDHFVGPAAPSRQHHGDADGRARPRGEAAGVRQGQTRHAAGLLPSVRVSCSRATVSAPRTVCCSLRRESPGLNYLCDGLKHFFSHTDRRMKVMAGLLQEGREAPDIMQILAEEAARTGRNDPCPCGSGRKFKACCGG